MFAVTSPTREQIHFMAFYGIDYHSHLATGYGGMAMVGDEIVTMIHSLKNSQFKTEFAKDLHLFDGAGNFIIGAIGSQAQPISINPINKKLGIFSICVNGYVDNADNLAVELLHQGIGFDYDELNGMKFVNQAKLVGRLISTQPNLIDGINYAFGKIKGSISLLLMNCHGIYAARAKHGHTLLTLGCKGDTWVVASETNSFSNLSVRPIRMLKPGEIVLISEKGPETIYEGCNQCQFCPFFWVYTGSPASEYYDMSAESYREDMGALLARKDFENGFVPASVEGVADSGTTYALGYASGSIDNGAPVKHVRSIIKYTPGWSRSYTPEKQLDRDLVALHKQIQIGDKWREGYDKDRVLTEDSIVRGTQLRQLLSRLDKNARTTWGLGPAKIHVRVGCPVLGWHCPYMGTTRSRDELASRKAIARLHKINVSCVTDEILAPYLEYGTDNYNLLVSAIAEDLGAKSVLFPTLAEMVSLTGLPESDLCTYCWTGRGV
jgi:amidophosphoribosyltransferase